MHSIIKSAQNSQIKLVRKLTASSKARREADTFIAEGIHLVRSFIEAGHVPIMYICAASALDNEEIKNILSGLDQSSDIDPVVVDDRLYESISSVHASVGILILFRSLSKSTEATLTQNSILLEDIQDPGNIGTILRTAAASGVTAAYLSKGCTSPWSPKALRAGMGAQFTIDIHEEVGLEDTIANSKVPVMATSLTATHSIYEKDLSAPSAWLFGNEGQGVSNRLLSLPVDKVIIPQHDKVESLNVAAAVAVCLFEQFRQQNG